MIVHVNDLLKISEIVDILLKESKNSRDVRKTPVDEFITFIT